MRLERPPRARLTAAPDAQEADASHPARGGGVGLLAVNRASAQEFRRPAEARPLLGAAF